MADVDIPLSETDRNLWSAAGSQALTLLKCQAYSSVAKEEGHPEVVGLLRDLADVTSQRALGHLRAVGAVKSTRENLQGLLPEMGQPYAEMAQQALDEGRFEAAGSFTQAMEEEDRLRERLSRAIGALDGEPAAGGPPTQEPTLEEDEAAAYALAAEHVTSERWRVAAATRIREVVFGAQDGLLSTVALITSVAAAGATISVVLVAGIATALAGMISMATGSFLGSKAARDVQKAEIEKEAKELEDHPDEEFTELVVLYQQEGMTYAQARELAEHITSDRDIWLRAMIEKELGLSAEITSSPLKDGLTMGAAFIAGATVPILPYFFLSRALAVPVSIMAALAGLFALGVGKGRLVNQSPLLQGLEILAIGTVAAILAFILGDGIPRLID